LPVAVQVLLDALRQVTGAGRVDLTECRHQDHGGAQFAGTDHIRSRFESGCELNL